MLNPEAYRDFCTHLLQSGIDAVCAEAGAVVCAFSGGADSTLLLSFLQPYCAQSGLSLLAVHVHHGIRGANADRDAAFCADFCAARGIPFRLCRVDVPGYVRENGCGLEEGARILRYRAIYDVSPENAVIATAHNATDQLETVLFHLCRGSGLRGLCGISPIRGRLVRPLLYLTGEEIRTLCERAWLSYVLDETNADPAYTRNYIRREIVPKLYEINPQAPRAVSQMTEHLQEDERILDEMADTAIQNTPGRAALLALPAGIRSRVLEKLYMHALPDQGGMEGTLVACHIRAMTRLLQSDRTNGVLDLPCGVRFLVDRDSVICAPHSAAAEEGVPFAAGNPTEFGFSADALVWENDRYLFVITPASQTSQKNQEKVCPNRENIYKISMQQRIDFAKINGVLCVRTRRSGDTIRYGGMTRRVKKLFSDRKLPLVCRNTLPLLLDDDGVVWLPGFPPRDGMASDGHTDTCRTLCLYERE